MFTKNHNLSQAQKQYITTTVMNGRVRTEKWRLTLAAVLAKSLHLSKVDDLNDYIISEVRPMIRSRLSELVELIPFNLEGMVDYVEEFWRSIYNIAYGGFGFIVTEEPSTVFAVFGGNSPLSLITRSALQVDSMSEANAMNEDIRFLKSIIDVLAIKEA